MVYTNSPEPPVLLTIDETAKALGVCRRSVHALIRAGKLERVQLEPLRSVRVRRADVLALCSPGSVAIHGRPTVRAHR